MIQVIHRLLPWNRSDYLLDQIINYAILIFKTLYPDAIAIFAFNNSTNHNAMPDNCLNIQKINLKPKGKQSLMYNIYFSSNNILQNMVFSSDYHIYSNQPKEIRQVLLE